MLEDSRESFACISEKTASNGKTNFGSCAINDFREKRTMCLQRSMMAVKYKQSAFCRPFDRAKSISNS